MKWDREDKKRLQKVIYAKLCLIADQSIKAKCKVCFKHFFGTFGIRRVRLVESNKSSRVWVYYHTLDRAKSNSRVIILNPWHGRTGHGNGLSIPKDVAEKFLILGVP